MQRVYIILICVFAIVTLLVSVSFVHPLKNKRIDRRDFEIEYNNMIVAQPNDVNISFLPESFDERNGNCISLSINFEGLNHDWELVSATEIEPSTSILFSHMFNEKDNIVFDPVLGKFYEKEKYYKFYSVSNITKYNAS